jgi:hypothetical protein
LIIGGQNVYDRVEHLPDEVKKARVAYVHGGLYERGSLGICYDTPGILKKALGRSEEVLEKSAPRCEIPEDFQKIQFWKGFSIICEG